MPTASVNGIEINYKLEGDGPETIVLINGLADDLETWVLQMDDLLGAGYRVLRFDNRGVGQTSAPPGPYTSRMMADDAKALVDAIGISGFHLLGTSMGGMIAQEYAINHGSDLKSATFSSTYAAPGPFCSRMFSMWQDMAPVNGVPFIMRDVTLWAFTVPFFEAREDELKEFEAEMAQLPQSLDAYLAQLSSIRTHDCTDRLREISAPTLVLAGEEDYFTPYYPRLVAERIRGARLELMTGPGSSHGLPSRIPKSLESSRRAASMAPLGWTEPIASASSR